MSAQPGSLVRYREREWVVLPSEDAEVLLLRPLGGSGRELCGVYRPLANLLQYSLAYEGITPTQFPLPGPDAVQDHAAVRLLIHAARLLLREEAAPFRSLGRLSIRPRPYQFVPLLMALRLDTVRLLIADDVGVGKTIEAALIARELLDRGEVRRLAVLCPPYLCDQWQKELAEKFQIKAEVIRAGTVSRLERHAPPDRSIFQHYRHFVASIDLVKGDRYRAAFLQHCPELVLVDEVHGAAQPPGERRARAQQQRHELLRSVAAKPERHLILLTATPHSGVEASFLSILSLLKPEFVSLNLSHLSEASRTELARYFVQRRRADVKKWMGEETPFPERDEKDIEQAYRFSQAYREFYDDVYEFASEMVRSAETLRGWKRRMRFWSALALLRCVTSSPRAAEVALLKRASVGDGGEQTLESLEAASDEELDATFEPVVYDPLSTEAAVDMAPGSVFDAQEQDPDWGDRDRRRLRQFARKAQELGGAADIKLQKLVEVVSGLLRDGYHPIVWCRYIATADYVAGELDGRLAERFSGLRVVSVTGAISDDERRLKVDELVKSPRRILVATDCLSEGINLQEHFTAVVHYDLPWNPNRLEQREGRVDRFGQTAPRIKAVLIYGQDNPVDGAVLEVLLRKAREIHRDLGIYVPVPRDSETVMEAVLNSLFTRARPAPNQPTLFDALDDAREIVKGVHEEWNRAAARERESRTRFAQRAVKPEEVERELKETDGVLGHPNDVRAFLQEASQRLPFGFRKQNGGKWELRVADLPPSVRLRLGDVPDPWVITFDSPTPQGIAYVGRNHPLVEALSEHLLDMAFHPPADSETPAARCGVIRTDQVSRRTTVLLLRRRYLLHERDDVAPALAEETLAWGFGGSPPNIAPLSLPDARQLMDGAQPSANVPLAEKRAVLAETLGWWVGLQAQLGELLQERAQQLQQAHHRVRRLLRREPVRIEPQTPPDLLGLLVLLPVPRGVKQ